ncbi:hypothetical protein [Kitasatospora terrestris]|uniref:Lipoprotein n=1 Tax=Kitasatospora terrestris TaxID=258051 RepID=A0ABP9DU54_9ACTN
MGVVVKLRVVGAVAAVLLGGSLAAGCASSGGGGSADHALVEIGTARTEIDGLLDGTTKAVSPSLKYADDAFQARAHEDGVSREADGSAQLTRRRYVLTKVARGNQAKLLEKVREYWKAQGYTITESASTFEAGARTEDGVGITVSIGAPGNVTISANAWVKDPKSEQPFGAAPSPLPTKADGTVDTMPKYDDPEWSR